jgi:hypothetical protein
MRVVNTTGFSHDTRVYDEEGNDLTRELRITKIEIVAGERNRVILTCEDVKVDVTGDQQ